MPMKVRRYSLMDQVMVKLTSSTYEFSLAFQNARYILPIVLKYSKRVLNFAYSLNQNQIYLFRVLYARSCPKQNPNPRFL